MMSNYLKSKSTFLGEAEMAGNLYKVDFFPGATYEPESGTTVLGELYHIPEPESVLEVLDTYEGYDPKQPENGLFQRKEVMITFRGEEFPAWAYLYNLPTEDLQPIPDGDFLKFDMESHA